MIAPSSDWFVGFSNICATDEDGAWLSEMKGALVAYDAGTATGDDFMPKSADTEPREPIAELDVAPVLRGAGGNHGADRNANKRNSVGGAVTRSPDCGTMRPSLVGARHLKP